MYNFEPTRAFGLANNDLRDVGFSREFQDVISNAPRHSRRQLQRRSPAQVLTLGASGWTTFRRIILPSLYPALLGGAGLAFARAIGEFGSVVLIGGGIPHKTQVASQYIAQQIEIDRPASAAAVSVALLVISFTVLFVLRRFGTQQR